MTLLLLDTWGAYFSAHRSLLSWILIGLIAGWLAGKISRGRGFGCIGNVLIGLVGAVLGGWIFTKLNIIGGPGSGDSGFIYSLAAATVGAVVLVAVARLFSGNRND
jgi:uncharacterized membrane protein YeaQ/YmgE (transglycosylase-associated protein family)